MAATYPTHTPLTVEALWAEVCALAHDTTGRGQGVGVELSGGSWKLVADVKPDAATLAALFLPLLAPLPADRPLVIATLPRVWMVGSLDRMGNHTGSPEMRTWTTPTACAPCATPWWSGRTLWCTMTAGSRFAAVLGLSPLVWCWTRVGGCHRIDGSSWTARLPHCGCVPMAVRTAPSRALIA